MDVEAVNIVFHGAQNWLLPTFASSNPSLALWYCNFFQLSEDFIQKKYSPEVKRK